MAKIILALSALLLYGCAGQTIKTEAQETYVPILFCPAPPVIGRPELPIHQMSPTQINSSGEIVKHYKASVIVLQGYAVELEKALKQYENTNEAYDDLRKELINDIESKKGIGIQ